MSIQSIRNSKHKWKIPMIIVVILLIISLVAVYANFGRKVNLGNGGHEHEHEHESGAAVQTEFFCA